jgi:hypothetical protein
MHSTPPPGEPLFTAGQLEAIEQQRKQQRRLGKAGSPPRNKPCPCGSGLKYKKCHGKPPPPENRPRGSIYKTMRGQYNDEQLEAEQKFITQWGFVPNPTQLMVFMEGNEQELKDIILIGMKRLNAKPEYLYAVDKLNFLLSSRNNAQYTEEKQDLWNATLEEYREAHPEECQEESDDTDRSERPASS